MGGQGVGSRGRSRFSTPTSKCARQGPRFSTPMSKCARRGPRFSTPTSKCARRGPRFARCPHLRIEIWGTRIDGSVLSSVPRAAVRVQTKLATTKARCGDLSTTPRDETARLRSRCRCFGRRKEVRSRFSTPASKSARRGPRFARCPHLRIEIWGTRTRIRSGFRFGGR